MNYTQLRNIFVIAVSLFVMVSCGGGGGSSISSDTGGSSGIGSGSGSSSSTGVITGFGSVFVNGVEYDTAGATFTINGRAGIESDLKLGMVVTVHGSSSGATGKAIAIEFDHDAQGPVGNVDVANNWLEVMGQTVVVDNMTVFDGTTLGTIAVGNVVEVSGWTDANNVIHATRIEFKKANISAGVDEMEIEGAIANLDSNAQTFTIGDLTVSYGSATGLPGGGLSNGQFVKVTSTQGNNASDQLVAASIKVKDPSTAPQNKRLEVQGLVTHFSSASEFTVNNQKVQTTSSTQYENGTPADLALNAKVTVGGTLDTSGVLVADRVSIQAAATVQLEGNVAAVDTSAGTITVSGQTVTVAATTVMQDNSTAAIRSLQLADIAVGDQVTIVACQDGATLVACRLERTAIAAQVPPDVRPTVALLGTVDSVAAPNLVIMGVTIVTSANTTFKNGIEVVSSSAFFGAIAAGDTARATGTRSDDAIIATKLELMVNPSSLPPSLTGTVSIGANRVRMAGNGVYFDKSGFRPMSHGSLKFNGCTPALVYSHNGRIVTNVKFDGSKLHFKTGSSDSDIIATVSLTGCALQGAAYDGPFTSLTASGSQLEIWNGSALADTLHLDKVPAP